MESFHFAESCVNTGKLLLSSGLGRLIGTHSRARLRVSSCGSQLSHSNVSTTNQNAEISPVAFPGMSNISIPNLSPLCLFIQEVKHVFDGQGKGTGPVCCAEHCLKQVINKLLQCALQKTNTSGIYLLRWLERTTC